MLFIILSISAVSANENITYDKLYKNNEVVSTTLDENTNSLEVNSNWIEEENTTELDSSLKENVLSSANEDILNDDGKYDFYVSPDGTGDGKSENNPTNWTYVMQNSFIGIKIKLLDGTFYISNQEINYPNMTFVGSPNTVIDAQSTGRIFTITQENNILENITFINGKISNNGGALWWQGSNGMIKNCVFLNNYANYGGALYFTGAATNCTVINSRFERNSASNTGAIWWQGQYGSLINCNFTENKANYHAVVFWTADDGNISGCNFINGSSSNHDAGFGSNKNRINIEYCNFTNNRASTYGGALEIEGGSYFTISNCIFNDNYAGTYGGAIHNVASNSVIKNCSFNNNTARTHNNGGGAVYWNGANGQILDSNFTNNQVIKTDANYYLVKGGAIYWTGSSPKGIRNSNFFNNTAYSGSAIYTTQNIPISDSKFLDNLANSSEIEYTISENNITVYLKTFDNYINAIYSTTNLNSLIM